MLNQIALLKHFCDTICEYDPETERIYFYHDAITPRLCGQWDDYRTLYELYLNRYVCKADADVWKRHLSPEALHEFLQSTMNEDSFSVQMEHTRIGLQWHEIQLEHFGEHILIGSREIQKELRNAAVAQAILPEFDYISRIDVHTGGYVVYHSDHKNTIFPQREFDSYEKFMEQANRKNVIPEEASALTERMRLRNVIQHLSESSEYVLCAQNIGDIPTYKKFRFSYEDETKCIILLTCMDVSEIVQERKKREDAEKRHSELLTNMPIAICSTEVLLDAAGKPYDFRYTYCNPAHETLEGVQPGELLGKGFYEFFQNADPKWLNYYYETAWLGIPHVIRSYSSEIGKDLLIHTFRTEPGHCDCVVQDVTQQNFLLRELHQSREEMLRVLETTTVAVFQYDPATDEIQQNNYTTDECGKLYRTKDLWPLFVQSGHVHPDDLSVLQDAFSRIQKGEHNLSVLLRCTRRGTTGWLWFRMFLFDYQDENTKERKVLGYIQDVNHDMKQLTELRQQAQTDALTGILNVGAGRSAIQKLLSTPSHTPKAMFMMDVDNFKLVNDTYGHIMGDKTLKRFAAILSSVFDENAIVYRLGGDEFAVFLPQLTDTENEVSALAKKLHTAVRNAKADFPFLSISVGI